MTKLSYLALAAAAMLSACGGSGGGGSPPPTPEVAHAAQGNGGEILTIQVVDSAATTGLWDYDVEFDLGSGYHFRRDPIEEWPTELRIAIPLGRLNPATGLETGEIRIRVVRSKGSKSSYSPWRDFFVWQLTGGFFPPNGTVAMSAAKAAGSLVVHGVGDTWLVDENALGQLDFDAVLTAAAKEVDAFDVLRSLVERAMNGEVVAIGITPAGQPIVFESASLPLVDRLIATMHGALASELGSFPPDPQWLSAFYTAVAHDFEDNAADSVRIVHGASRFSFDLYEKAIYADGSGTETLDSWTMGAIAWFNVFSTGFSSGIAIDSLPAQAGVSQGSFTIVALAAEQGFEDVADIAFDHLGPASFFAGSYGPELGYAGEIFVEGLLEKTSLSANLEVGFASGLIPTAGLSPPEFTVGTQVNIGLGDYTVLVTTAPPSPNQAVSVRIVGFDGVIMGEDLMTDSFGEALAGPFQSGSSGTFDLVHGLNPEAGGPESQAGVIATFP